MIDYSRTRLLKQDEAELVSDILFEHNSISKIPYTETREESISNIRNSIAKENVRCIGYFEGNILESVLFQVISSKIPAWHMTLLATRSKHRWDYRLNGMDMCWANAMDFAERQKIFRIYWSLPERWARSQSRTILTSNVWNRYEIFIDDIILPYQFPTWYEHKASFGEKLKPHATVIKLGVLKNEYRKFN